MKIVVLNGSPRKGPNMESKGSMSTCPKLTEVEALGESL